MTRLLPSAPSLLAAVSMLAMAAAPTHAAAIGATTQYAVGRNANGLSCLATISWVNGGALRNKKDQPFVLTCGASTEPTGWVDVAAERPPIAPEQCGASEHITFDGIGAATLRRCRDPRLARETVVVEAANLRGSAGQAELAPLLTAMAAIKDRTATPRLVIVAPDLTAKLAPAPATGATATTVAAGPSTLGLDVSAALSQGLQAIYAGRNVEASRLLNDAIAQFATASTLDRAALRLNAALADSNIGEFDAADNHFALAAQLIAAAPPSPERARLASQARTYRALHLYNRGDWRGVLTELSDENGGRAPLSDGVTLARLNNDAGVAEQFLRDTNSANQLIVLAQENIARSMALTALGRQTEAEAALMAAKSQAVDPAQAQLAGASGSLNWLRARLERQEGRLRLARGDRSGAIASFDCALAQMHAVAPASGTACLFADNANTRGAPLAGPAIASAELERASILAEQPGVDRAQVLAQFDQAIAGLSAQSDGGFTASPKLTRYLSLLIEDAGAGRPGAADRYFAALQTVREPGIARELAALQAQVSSGAGGDLIRTRQALERQRNQLRYEVTTLAPDSPRLTEIRAQSADIATQLDKINAQLAGSGAQDAVDEKAITIADLQHALRPGEVYWKLVPVGSRIYGAVIGRDQASIYAVEGAGTDIAAMAALVLKSCVSDTKPDGTTTIRRFAEAKSYELFVRLAGPAAATLRAAQAVVVDTGAALSGLPVAVLVTQAPLAAPAKKPGFDYAATPFLIRNAEVATALSPRSFLRVRAKLPPSRAPEKLIGFGSSAAPAGAIADPVARTPVALTLGCSIAYGDWAEILARQTPVPVEEVRQGAALLGDPNAPIVTDAAFTNERLLTDSASGRLARYQVLHFATHGVSARPLPGHCDTLLPPALLTTAVAPAPGQQTPSNGLFTFIDVAKLHLDANLVLLSACDTAAGVSTASGRLAGQEESATLDGLVRAFFVAQARAVMATAWSIPARDGTARLVETFYREGRQSGMGQALRRAQLSVLADPRTSHPYFWAAFFLVGDGAKTMITGAPTLASR